MGGGEVVWGAVGGGAWCNVGECSFQVFLCPRFKVSRSGCRCVACTADCSFAVDVSIPGTMAGYYIVPRKTFSILSEFDFVHRTCML